jgi:hypothetical protein
MNSNSLSLLLSLYLKIKLKSKKKETESPHKSPEIAKNSISKSFRKKIKSFNKKSLEQDSKIKNSNDKSKIPPHEQKTVSFLIL